MKKVVKAVHRGLGAYILQKGGNWPCKRRGGGIFQTVDRVRRKKREAANERGAQKMSFKLWQGPDNWK